MDNDEPSSSEGINFENTCDIYTKLQRSEPYRYFLSKVCGEQDAPTTLVMSFADLLDKKLGIIRKSVQINFLVDVHWLMSQYEAAGQKNQSLIVLFGANENTIDVSTIGSMYPELTPVFIKTPTFGSHHTKMMFLQYTDLSIRVIITTGNLIESDWTINMQGMWISPRLPKVPNIKDDDVYEYDSETHFKRDLLAYVSSYDCRSLQSWMNRLKRADFRSVKVFFVSSSSGYYTKHATQNSGVYTLQALLKKHAKVPDNSWPLYCQCSSIGSFGSPQFWFFNYFINGLSCSSSYTTSPISLPNTKVVYPTFEDVAGSHMGLISGGVLPYTRASHSKQLWLHEFLCKWRSDCRNRTKAIPHMKSYCRVSPCHKYLSWFLLTSANLSKAAWGSTKANSEQIFIRSFEAGILFIPQFLIGKDKLPLTDEVEDDGPPFPFPYDLPLTPYDPHDEPWFIDVLY